MRDRVIPVPTAVAAGFVLMGLVTFLAPVRSQTGPVIGLVNMARVQRYARAIQTARDQRAQERLVVLFQNDCDGFLGRHAADGFHGCAHGFELLRGEGQVHRIGQVVASPKAAVTQPNFCIERWKGGLGALQVDLASGG